VAKERVCSSGDTGGEIDRIQQRDDYSRARTADAAEMTEIEDARK
jgi:hypothetical protein